MFNVKKNKKGFTLVELMVVVVIIGILTAIAIPVYNSVTSNAKVKTSLANQRTIDSAIEAYFAANSEYPDAIADLVPTYIAENPNDKAPFDETYGIDADAPHLCTVDWTGSTASATEQTDATLHS